MDWCNASGVDAPVGDGSFYCETDHDGTDICQQTYPDTDWRLPTAEEYSVLLEETGLGNADGKECDGDDGDTICTDMLGYVAGWYWSSSSDSDSNAWNAGFHYGRVNPGSKAEDDYVRCVRSGP
jgi:hypothetical protein